jgi:hypothetical protein
MIMIGRSETLIRLTLCDSDFKTRLSNHKTMMTRTRSGDLVRSDAVLLYFAHRMLDVGVLYVL